MEEGSGGWKAEGSAHGGTLDLAASCSSLHTTVHSSPSLWQRLTLRPTVLATTANTTQPLLAMLRRHRHSRHAEYEKMRQDGGRTEIWNDNRRRRWYILLLVLA